MARAKIMYVDDETNILKIVKSRLDMAGHEVHTFSSGKEAMEKLDAIHPNLVILDYQMPDLSGPEICFMIRQKPEYENTPVVFFTCVEEEGVEAVCYKSGATAICYKPTVADLIEKVKELLPS